MQSKPLTGALRDILSAPELSSLDPLHLVSSSNLVQDVRLIRDIEEIPTIRPDTIIVLMPEVAQGGWMIAAALRYAWERRACALVVPKGTYTDTVVALAERLGISMFASGQDLTRVTLDIAIQIGVARAGSLGRLQTFSGRLAQVDSLRDALKLISDELNGASVELRSQNTRTVRVGLIADDKDEEPALSSTPNLVSTQLPGADELLVTSVLHRNEVAFAEKVLGTAAPHIKSVLARMSLSALRAALPIMSLVAATGWPPTEDLDPPADVDLPTSIWPLSGPYVAVCITSKDLANNGPAVQQIWNDLFPKVPLVLFAEGWLGFVPVPGRRTGSDLTRLARRRIDRVHAFDVRVGVSRLHATVDTCRTAIAEAWAASKLHWQVGTRTPFVAFDSVATRMPARLLSRDFAIQLVALTFPAFAADSAHNDLARAVVAYLNHHGSTTAASTALGVHRNTLQSRLRRAEELGIRLDASDTLLSTHLLLAALLSQSS